MFRIVALACVVFVVVDLTLRDSRRGTATLLGGRIGRSSTRSLYVAALGVEVTVAAFGVLLLLGAVVDAVLGTGRIFAAGEFWNPPASEWPIIGVAAIFVTLVIWRLVQRWRNGYWYLPDSA